VPTFNVDIDDYPMSGKAIEIMMDMVSSGTIQLFCSHTTGQGE